MSQTHRHETFPFLLFLPPDNFFSIAGSHSAGEGRVHVPCPQGFDWVQSDAPALPEQEAAGSERWRPTGLVWQVVVPMGHQLKTILALTGFAFSFKIHWNLTAKPTSISAPEQLSNLRASAARVILF